MHPCRFKCVGNLFCREANKERVCSGAMRLIAFWTCTFQLSAGTPALLTFRSFSSVQAKLRDTNLNEDAIACFHFLPSSAFESVYSWLSLLRASLSYIQKMIT